jgi:predicted enzyme related to lactoylglutathione lyase
VSDRRRVEMGGTREHDIPEGSTGLQLQAVTLTSRNPERLAAFWANALGYEERRDTDEEIVLAATSWTYPWFSIHRCDSGPAPDDKAMHIDFTTADMEAEVARLLQLGAVKLWTISIEESGTTTWTTMQDPDGNRFCVMQKQR